MSACVLGGICGLAEALRVEECSSRKSGAGLVERQKKG